jgi:hypothetical protein
MNQRKNRSYRPRAAGEDPREVVVTTRFLPGMIDSIEKGGTSKVNLTEYAQRLRDLRQNRTSFANLDDMDCKKNLMKDVLQ